MSTSDAGSTGGHAASPRRPVRGDRREDLLSAAAGCFVEVGLRGTTMELIASRAGAGKATLYRHFGNKDEVIAALLEREVDRFITRITAAGAAEGPAPDRLDAAFVAGVEFLLNHPVLVRGRDEDPAELLGRIGASTGSFAARCSDLFAGIVRDGIDEGTLRPVDAEVVAEALVRLLLSWFAFPDLGVPRRGRQDLQRLVGAVVSGGLVSATGTRPGHTT